MARKSRKSRAKRHREEALFRHHVISSVLALEFGGEVRAEAIRRVSSIAHFTSDGRCRKVSVRTIYRWIAAYGEDGSLENLEPQKRHRIDTSVALPEAFIDFIREEKACDPRASAPELIRRAEICKIIEPDARISRSTVWRACKRMGLPTKQRPQKREGDMRRFAYPHRMMMALCDGKHFRAGATRKKRVALVFLDDATRYGLDVRVGTSESTELFLGAFHEVIQQHGCMNVIYMDHGAGFISNDTKAVIASLPHVYLINGAKAYPEGHGLCVATHNPCYVQFRIMCSKREPPENCCETAAGYDQVPLSRTTHNSDPAPGRIGQKGAASWMFKMVKRSTI